MSYNSKYTGQQVEELLDQIKNGSVGGSAYPMVDHGTSDTTFVLTPNEFHIWDKVATLSLSFENESAGVVNEYVFQFTSGYIFNESRPAGSREYDASSPNEGSDEF